MPHTLHPTPHTLHPTPYTPHPTPYTLHPTPHTLHPTKRHYEQSRSGNRGKCFSQSGQSRP
ncbi:MAG: hypothetical protein F6J93_15200 [Oscillatoria sp. SIO1A7]|nr:hypothetical protein [Oscillatoria sp. SIO1A7]